MQYEVMLAATGERGVMSHGRHRLFEPKDTTALIINGPAPHVFRLGFSHRSTKQDN